MGPGAHSSPSSLFSLSSGALLLSLVPVQSVPRFPGEAEGDGIAEKAPGFEFGELGSWDGEWGDSVSI